MGVTDPYLQSVPWMTKIFLELNRHCQFGEDLKFVSNLNLCLNRLYFCTIKHVQFKSLFTLSHRGSDSSQLLIVFSNITFILNNEIVISIQLPLGFTQQTQNLKHCTYLIG